MAGKVALVLEGGGLRGQFTAGVLDVFLEQGLTGFDVAYGVSAGAINAADFKAGQNGRMMRDTLAYRDDKRFMSLYSLATTGDLTGVDFVYDEVQNRLDPFDSDAFMANPMRMVAVVSDVTFGTPDYLEVAELPEDIDKVRASASLPVVSKIVDLDGHRYLDGGTTDSVPVERAMADGATRLVVVLTRDRGYVKEGPYELMAAARVRYADFPYYLEVLANRAPRYMEQREHIWQLEREGAAVVVAPPEPVDISATSVSGGELLTLYLQGRTAGLAAVEQVRAALAG
ncbi:MAG: patatin family protein [Atopobiaceae bacterium]|jgi:predicted patatin/cPLA2 family phospholipase|nr:patatin family protein [Atopobiaceae bacterium]MCH4213722.1 patatin family protein [Atopobiaceae bacterium]MCH4230067.1 patatin family protein [Atopobiaceae bacterium]MCH4275921.1 patatin family protein [Atopobiaceae bacterium]MCI1225678.1 patatin family protein [Atopobiaceae bacterium]